MRPCSRRRVLLATGGVLSLAGCSSRSSPDDARELTVETTSTDDSPLSLAVSVERATMTDTAPARLRFALTNEDPGPARYFTGAPRPFGVLTAGDHPLWTDAYPESSHVETDGRRVTRMEDVAFEVTVGPGATTTETYGFVAPTGTYTVERSGSAFELDDVQYTVELTVRTG